MPEVEPAQEQLRATGSLDVAPDEAPAPSGARHGPVAVDQTHSGSSTPPGSKPGGPTGTTTSVGKGEGSRGAGSAGSSAAPPAKKPPSHLSLVPEPAAELAAEPAAAKGKKPPMTLLTQAAPKGWARLSETARAWIERQGLTEEAKASLSRAGPDIVEAVNRFHDVKGFDRVLQDYMAGGPKQAGARFVMRFAREHFGEQHKASMAFEMESQPRPIGREGNKILTEPSRYLDLWVGGERYEFKSVIEVRSELVTGRKGKFGQLQKDMIDASGRVRNQGGGPADLMTELDHLHWVFDSQKMKAANLTRADVVRQVGDTLFGSGLFEGHPYEAQIRAKLNEIIVFWP